MITMNMMKKEIMVMIIVMIIVMIG